MSEVGGAGGRRRGRHRASSSRWGRVALAVVAVLVVLAVALAMGRLLGGPQERQDAAGEASASSGPQAPVPAGSPSGTAPPGSPSPAASDSAAATDGSAPTSAASPAPERPRDAAGRAAAQLAAFDARMAAAVPGALIATAPLGEGLFTGPGKQVGDWERTRLPGGRTLAQNNELALRSGQVRAARDLSRTGTTARVVTPDGRFTLPVDSPAAVLATMRSASGPACRGCRDVVLTGPRSTTMTVDATRGEVTVPAYEFGVTGSKVRLVRPALAPTALVQPGPVYRGKVPDDVAAQQLPLWEVTVDDDRRTVRTAIDRGEVAARGGCWRLQARESARGVALFAAQGKADSTGACADSRGRTSVRLAAPVGSRTLLDTYWQRALSRR